MRYLTWRLNWIDGCGYGPESVAADNGATMEASSFVDETGTHLGYLTGDFDLDLVVDYDVAELAAGEALAFAQTFDDTAFILDDGRIGVVEREASLG